MPASAAGTTAAATTGARTAATGAVTPDTTTRQRSSRGRLDLWWWEWLDLLRWGRLLGWRRRL